MTTMYKRSHGNGAILCENCLPRGEVLLAAALEPRFFPGRFHQIRCALCGHANGERTPSLPVLRPSYALQPSNRSP